MSIFEVTITNCKTPVAYVKDTLGVLFMSTDITESSTEDKKYFTINTQGTVTEYQMTRQEIILGQLIEADSISVDEVITLE